MFKVTRLQANYTYIFFCIFKRGSQINCGQIVIHRLERSEGIDLLSRPSVVLIVSLYTVDTEMASPFISMKSAQWRSEAKPPLLAPRLEATAPVDVGGIAFPIFYPTRPVVFILLTPVNISKTISPKNFCSILEPGSYY